jgi:hypothetical protein
MAMARLRWRWKRAPLMAAQRHNTAAHQHWRVVKRIQENTDALHRYISSPYLSLEYAGMCLGPFTSGNWVRFFVFSCPHRPKLTTSIRLDHAAKDALKRLIINTCRVLGRHICAYDFTSSRENNRYKCGTPSIPKKVTQFYLHRYIDIFYL